jgi:hypothetical protein
MANPSDLDNPTEVTDRQWLLARRQQGDYPEQDRNGGKWLVFMPTHLIDEVWRDIREATERGELGALAKVSTAMPNPKANDKSEKVICVYTYDYTDVEDVRRIRQVLRRLGITHKIPYKADEDTYDGRYTIKGHQRISKYYE